MGRGPTNNLQTPQQQVKTRRWKDREMALRMQIEMEGRLGIRRRVETCSWISLKMINIFQTAGFHCGNLD